MAKSKHYYIRKSHRWLGLLLGIQFLMWTIGGLYFSWNNIDEIHGDHEKKHPTLFPSNIALISPTVAVNNIKEKHPIDSVISIQLIDILDKPYYQIQCITAVHSSNKHEMHKMIHLANAENGVIRNALTKKEAIEVAKRRFNSDGVLKSVEYLTSTNAHHEYRENPLPAYAITFDHPTNTTVYVASEMGTVQKFRNNKWRIFDFLWMLHTMDYKGRDNFGNILLRIFSVFGLFTVVSGFVLFFISAKRFN